MFKFKNEPTDTMGNILLIAALCLILEIVIGSIFINQVFAAEINAFQKFIIEALHLRDTPRHAMTDELFDYFEENNFDIDEMTSYFEGKYFSGKLSYDELKEALTVFSERSEDGKLNLYTLLYEGASKLEQSGMEYCTSVIGKFNEVIIGDPGNKKGISTLITLFKKAEFYSEGDIIIYAQNANPATDIKFIVEGDESAKVKLSSAMNHFTSLVEAVSSYSGSNNLEKFISYSETIVNNETLDEVYAFKMFLNYNGIFNGIPAVVPEYAKLLSVKDRQFINDDGDFLNNMIEGYIRATAKITLNTDDDGKTQSVSYIISLYDKTAKPVNRHKKSK